MSYLKTYSIILSSFLLHIVFNLVNNNNISNIRPISWLLVLVGMSGFVWSGFYVERSKQKFKWIAYVLVIFGILLSVAQVVLWYMFKDVMLF